MAMILDDLANAGRYERLAAGMAVGFAFLRRADLAALAPGRYAIDGDRVYASVARVRGKARGEARLEVHRDYLDIQYVIGGYEEIGWRPRATCRTVTVSYDRDKDIEFFGETPDSWVTPRPGQFTIFFPDDAHLPAVGPAEIHKVVVKVRCE